VNHPNIKVNYDAGNVLDYLDKDPIPDIKKCADEVRSFCIKDHRNWPKDEDRGFGEIDHYRRRRRLDQARPRVPGSRRRGATDKVIRAVWPRSAPRTPPRG